MLKYILTLAIALVFLTKTFAQNTTTSSELLTTKQVKELFPESLLNTLNIHFPIFRVYRYDDQSGKYYCLLTESRDTITAQKDTFNYQIKAITVQLENGTFKKLWEINDHLIKNDNEEQSIWFWTKYTSFNDYDGDGLIDPVIIYGTFGLNGYDDGRIKMILYYKGKKVAIRHQNGLLDSERETQVDQSFYALPKALQSAVINKMELMMENNHAIFPSGWEEAMKNKKGNFNERNR